MNYYKLEFMSFSKVYNLRLQAQVLGDACSNLQPRKIMNIQQKLILNFCTFESFLPVEWSSQDLSSSPKTSSSSSKLHQLCAAERSALLLWYHQPWFHECFPSFVLHDNLRLKNTHDAAMTEAHIPSLEEKHPVAANASNSEIFALTFDTQTRI